MSALLALAPFEREPAEREVRPRPLAAHDERSFHHEIEHARREPAKRAAPRAASRPEQRKPRPEDAAAPSPDGTARPAIEVKREVADVAKAVTFSAVGETTGSNLDALIDQSASAAATQVATSATDPDATPPLSPLEQAVHDLIEQLRDGREDNSSTGESGADPGHGEPLPGSFGALGALAPLDDRDGAAPAPVAPTAAARELDPEPAAAANPSHVHLVIDEAERLVVTVAVRGDSVITHVRGGDEATAAALARNAGSLDHAMRARGLQLTEFTASRDESSSERSDQPRRERERPQPKFNLEETP
ncbi:MAG: flagellar hook-length control protein FliK [Myxococcales bacterium]|nr:flagellar hook-length control protein FliK [Myxococcales bacterium]